MVQRSPSSHTLKARTFSLVAHLRREEPFRSADNAEWKAEADRIGGGPGRWYSWAGWMEDNGCKLIGFATQAEADEMQQCITESGIETRPAPPKYNGPQLSVANYNKNVQE